MEIEVKRIELDLTLLEANTGQLAGVPANPRKQSAAEYERLKASLEEDPEFMQYRELLVVPHRDKYVVVCGNMRIKALASMGVKKAWCKILPTDPEKIRRYIIKDDVSYGEWDAEMLAADWDKEQITDWGVELPEFNVNSTSCQKPQFTNLPSELDGLDIEADKHEKYEGTDETPYKRIIIMYQDGDEKALAEMLKIE